jgi:hypothetical protein
MQAGSPGLAGEVAETSKRIPRRRARRRVRRSDLHGVATPDALSGACGHEQPADELLGPSETCCSGDRLAHVGGGP